MRSGWRTYLLWSSAIAGMLALLIKYCLPLLVSYTAAESRVITAGDQDKIVYCFTATMGPYDVSHLFVVYDRPLSVERAEIPKWMAWKDGRIVINGKTVRPSLLRGSSGVYILTNDGTLTESFTEAESIEQYLASER